MKILTKQPVAKHRNWECCILETLILSEALLMGSLPLSPVPQGERANQILFQLLILKIFTYAASSMLHICVSRI